MSVDGDETRLIFVDHQDGEMSLENQLSTYCPDGFLVVFAVDDESSLSRAENILHDIKPELEHKPCILVANKTDLVRNRIVRNTGIKPSALCMAPKTPDFSIHTIGTSLKYIQSINFKMSGQQST